MTRIRFLAALACALLALPALASAKPIHRARWLRGVAVTEYYPAPEAWFVGRKVRAPGLPGRHRIDWLYSATGVSMQGEGVGLDGLTYHIDALGSGGWVNARARPTAPGRRGWRGGPPAWRAGAYWLTRSHRLTFPLDGGGWSNGVGRRYVRLPGVTFAEGHAKPLRFWQSIAVDPRLIPLGSKVYIAAYRNSPGHGWFLAQDVGGAIIGRHVDVYRSPPASADIGAGSYAGQRIYVIPPGRRPGRGAPPPPPPDDSGDPADSGASGDPGGSGGAGATGGGATTTSPPPSTGGGAGAP